MPIPSVRLLTAAVWALLDAHTVLPVYRSVVDPPPATDASGQLLTGYAVLHPGGGDPATDNLAMGAGRLLWGFQVSCVGGTHDQVGWAIDEVRGLLDTQSLTVDGAVVGRLQPPLGYNAPPPRPEFNAQPPRLMVPLMYQVLTASA